MWRNSKSGIEYSYSYQKSSSVKQRNAHHCVVWTADKLNSVKYRIELIRGNQTLVVHHNHLKFCKSDPQTGDQLPWLSPTPDTNNAGFI